MKATLPVLGLFLLQLAGCLGLPSRRHAQQWPKIKCNAAEDQQSLDSSQVMGMILNGCEQVSERRCHRRGQFECTPSDRCDQKDMISDAPKNVITRRTFKLPNHSDCTVEGEVCCRNPLPEKQRCQRGQFECTLSDRCDRKDMISDAPKNTIIKQTFKLPSHSECTREGEVCCKKTKVAKEPYVPNCGRRIQGSIKKRILNTNDTTSVFGEFPWLVSVQRTIGLPNGMAVMGSVGAGSLVHPQVVLTAAHKVEQFVNNSGQLTARLGEWDTAAESEPRPHKDIAVSAIKLHPSFDSKFLYDNLALLILDHSVQLQPHIDTLCLPSPDVNYDGASCVTAGWGKSTVENGIFPTVLRRVDLPHVPRGECEEAFRKIEDFGSYYHLDKSFTCAGGTVAGQDACDGDGGAPLACRDPQQPDKWAQVGIVSWGYGCGKVGVPGVYADVRRHLQWITEVIDQL